MKAMFRIAALFMAYGAIGYGGDFAVGLLANEARPAEVAAVPDVPPVPDVQVSVQPRVHVDVRPTVVSRVRVRHVGSCEYTDQSEVTVPMDDLRGLVIRAGSGELHVEGRSELEEVVVVGLMCASHEEYLDDLSVGVGRSSGGDLLVETHYPTQRVRDWSGDNTARIDLTVLMPLGTNVDIDDSSGDMEVSGTGDLRVDDSSGSIRISDVTGSLRVDDSSGDLTVSDVAGDVDIDDGSGNLEVTDVGGSVSLDDGSGSIELARIEHDVTVESDGSGSIEVVDVGGDFVVSHDGSGGIRYSGVTGRVDIPTRARRGR